jgi:hypothetical protein
MIIDKELYIADSLDVKATRAYSTTIDQVLAGDAKAGSELYLGVQVTTDFTRAAGAIGSTFSLQTHTADDFTSDRTVLWSSGSIAKASLTAGTVVARVRVPRGALRYLKLVVVNANAADAANIDAFLTPTVQDN